MGGEYYSCRMEKLSNADKDTLIESHAITPSLKRKKEPAGLILSDDESISVMINDEDHVHIQAIKAGYNLREAYKQANLIDDFIDAKKPYCFSDKYGYLTSRLQDAGTGLHASYMLSLPGITMGGKADALQEEISRFDVTLKGIYGEGSKSAGFIFQVSNRKTLGLSENEILENLEQVTAQIVDIEKKLRREVLKNIGMDLKDRIYRSYGVLRYAKNLAQKDAMVLLAQLKFGSDCGIINIKGGGSRLHRLMIEMQPGNLQTICKKTMGSVQRDEQRAKYLNEHLPELIEEEEETED
jgi:protein arginine kinase